MVNDKAQIEENKKTTHLIIRNSEQNKTKQNKGNQQ